MSDVWLFGEINHRLQLAKWPVCLLCFSCLLFPGLQAFANDNDWTRLTQYRHRAWRDSEGWFSGKINEIAQGPDGYIWIATATGILRFDGVRFSAWLPPAGRKPMRYATSLLASREGAMWIVSDQGLSVYEGAELRDVPLPVGTVQSLFEDHTGSVWAAMAVMKAGEEHLPVCNVSLRPAKCYGPDEGLTVGYATSMMEDHEGYFWIASVPLVRWKPGTPQVEYFAEALKGFTNDKGVTQLLSLSDGSVLAGLRAGGESAGVQQWQNGRWQSFKTSSFDGAVSGGEIVFQDRKGAIWLSPSGPGLVHLENGQADTFMRSDGLSGDGVMNIIQDAEGTVWVATDHGLDNFSALPVITYSVGEGVPPEGAGWVAARPDGGIVVSYHQPVSIKNGVIQILPGFQNMPREGSVRSMLIDSSQNLWLAQGSQMYLYRDGVPKVVKTPSGADRLSSGESFEALVEDSNHKIWCLINGNHRQRLVLLAAQGMQQVADLLLPSVHILAADHTGGLWVGGRSNQVGYFKSGNLTTKTLADASADFAAHDMYVDSEDRLWVSSNRGLRILDAGKTTSVRTETGLPCNSIFSVMIDRDSNLWATANCGLMRISQSEWTTLLHSPRPSISVKLFGPVEGWTLGSVNASSRFTQATDGKLWFSGNDLRMVDPSNIEIDPVALPIHIEQVVVDRKPYRFDALGSIPPNPREVQIDYSAPSSLNPRTITFKYKLEGHDDSWQEPGTRRQAFYTDLHPGHYRFQVAADQLGIVSSQRVDSVEFTVRPTFYQTRWFQALLCLAVIALLWLAYRIRLQQLQGRLGERLRERERIARELHDTLIQSAQGVILVFQGFAGQLAKPDPTRQKMEAALDHADLLLNEARARVTDLRTTEINDDVVRVLTIAGIDLFAKDPERFKIRVTGTERPLSHLVADEIYHIGREALTNASLHAEATLVEIEISFEATQLRLLVRDNGLGINSEVQESGGRPQHFGLRGMRERAEQIDAQFSLQSVQPGGTEIIVIVPSETAYATDARRHWALTALARIGFGARR
jgi:signal transduction histidine kinase/ligand-binding sensor domain-containing protein